MSLLRTVTNDRMFVVSCVTGTFMSDVLLKHWDWAAERVNQIREGWDINHWPDGVEGCPQPWTIRNQAGDRNAVPAHPGGGAFRLPHAMMQTMHIWGVCLTEKHPELRTVDSRTMTAFLFMAYYWQSDESPSQKLWREILHACEKFETQLSAADIVWAFAMRLLPDSDRASLNVIDPFSPADTAFTYEVASLISFFEQELHEVISTDVSVDPPTEDNILDSIERILERHRAESKAIRKQFVEDAPRWKKTQSNRTADETTSSSDDGDDASRHVTPVRLQDFILQYISRHYDQSTNRHHSFVALKEDRKFHRELRQWIRSQMKKGGASRPTIRVREGAIATLLDPMDDHSAPSEAEGIEQLDVMELDKELADELREAEKGDIGTRQVHLACAEVLSEFGTSEAISVLRAILLAKTADDWPPRGGIRGACARGLGNVLRDAPDCEASDEIAGALFQTLTDTEESASGAFGGVRGACIDALLTLWEPSRQAKTVHDKPAHRLTELRRMSLQILKGTAQNESEVETVIRRRCSSALEKKEVRKWAEADSGSVASESPNNKSTDNKSSVSHLLTEILLEAPNAQCHCLDFHGERTQPKKVYWDQARARHCRRHIMSAWLKHDQVQSSLIDFLRTALLGEHKSGSQKGRLIHTRDVTTGLLFDLVVPSLTFCTGLMCKESRNSRAGKSARCNYVVRDLRDVTQCPRCDTERPHFERRHKLILSRVDGTPGTRFVKVRAEQGNEEQQIEIKGSGLKYTTNTLKCRKCKSGEAYRYYTNESASCDICGAEFRGPSNREEPFYLDDPGTAEAYDVGDAHTLDENRKQLSLSRKHEPTVDEASRRENALRESASGEDESAPRNFM